MSQTQSQMQAQTPANTQKEDHAELADETRYSEYIEEKQSINDTDQISGARILMARKLADILVLPSGHISSNERALVGDILLQILEKVEYELRVDIAERFASVPEVPSVVLHALLLDRPNVAAPLLESDTYIPEELLIDCAAKGEGPHRLMIARRYGLTTPVADEILRHNEADVAKLILRREECRLSQDAVELLVSRATLDDEMQSLLLRRRELEPVHGFVMFWWVSPSARRKILTRFTLDRTIVQEALDGLYPIIRDAKMPDNLVKEILALNERRHRPRGVNGENVSMEIIIRTLVLSRQYATEDIIEALGLIAGVSRELIARILRDPGGEAFAVMCKSLGVPRLDYYDILTAPADGVFDDGGESIMSIEQADELLAVFDTMARDFSRAVMRYWDWSGNPRLARMTKLLTENSPIAE